MTRRFSLRKTAGLLLAAAVLVGVASVAQASGNDPSPRSGRTLGMVPAVHSAGGSLGSGKLVYHNGPVEHANTTYAIYWVPSGYTISSDYSTVINRFFTDVAADSGQTSNVYYSDTQYGDGSGKISYSSSFAGSTVDTNPFPANGCSDSYTSVCLSDAQLQSEIRRVVAANGWPTGSTTEYFMFIAKGVGSCAGSSCAFSQYCAYHSWIGSGSSEILYANMPYADTVPAACDAGQHPNNSDADATINVTSHEHNETITDENGNAWYDRRGYENGDKCAWKFGTQLGSTAYGQYNQLINGHTYELQMEYSNAHSGCVLTGT
jgi:hypothetical protein